MHSAFLIFSAFTQGMSGCSFPVLAICYTYAYHLAPLEAWSSGCDSKKPVLSILILVSPTTWHEFSFRRTGAYVGPGGQRGDVLILVSPTFSFRRMGAYVGPGGQRGDEEATITTPKRRNPARHTYFFSSNIESLVE
ncbi:hypothetical protein K438DRAFT_1936839 [Mycena galopus ATCC 62051]|nr:hypothetical protein K438DRAFT_1936839 [Mycena galopus ATCC 62051]